jgi:hypothetical protein
MRNLSCSLIIALVIVSLLFNLECSPSRRPTLQIKSRITSSSGESAGLSPVNLHLLDVDPFHLVMSGGHESTPQGSEVYRVHPRLKILAGTLNARRFGGYSLSPDVFLFIDQSRPLWELHVIKSGQTDSKGNASLEDLTPGSYWLLAYSELRGAEAFWVQQVDIKNGTNEVELQRSNALYIGLNLSQYHRNTTRTRSRF